MPNRAALDVKKRNHQQVRKLDKRTHPKILERFDSKYHCASTLRSESCFPAWYIWRPCGCCVWAGCPSWADSHLVLCQFNPNELQVWLAVGRVFQMHFIVFPSWRDFLVFAGYFMYFKNHASGWPLLCQLQVQQRLLELPRANRWSANFIKKHVAHHLQDFVNLHVHCSLAADFRWHKHGQQVPSWVCFFKCVDSARLFECVWRFDPGADIGLPAENLSSSLSTTCLKFLSFEKKVWETDGKLRSLAHKPQAPLEL